MGYSPRGHKQSDMIEHTLNMYMSCIYKNILKIYTYIIHTEFLVSMLHVQHAFLSVYLGDLFHSRMWRFFFFPK